MQSSCRLQLDMVDLCTHYIPSFSSRFEKYSSYRSNSVVQYFRRPRKMKNFILVNKRFCAALNT